MRSIAARASSRSFTSGSDNIRTVGGPFAKKEQAQEDQYMKRKVLLLAH